MSRPTWKGFIQILARVNWDAVGVIVAILFLVFTVSSSNDEIKRSTDINDRQRVATEIQLLTQMHQVTTESSASFYSKHGRQFVDYLSGWRKDLSDDAWTDLHKMLTDIEYAAFLFNRGHIRDEQARQMWIPTTRTAIANGFEAIRKARQDDPAKTYPECQKILEKAQANGSE